MKIPVLFLSLVMFIPVCWAQNPNPQYDKALADSLGADEYGMKSYILVILKTGSNHTTDEKVLNRLFRGHMDNITRLASMNKLIVAGPLVKNDRNYRGIFILNVKSRDEAKALLDTDPTIKEKIFEPELYEWYGSAALPAYMKVHHKIEKQQH